MEQPIHRGQLISPEKNLNIELPKLSDLNNFKGFKTVSLNVRSLLPKINLLRTDLADTKFDVFAVCESWLKPNVDESLILMVIMYLDQIDRP